MTFFNELKKNLSSVTDTVAKTSENVMKKSSTAIEIQKAKLKRVSLEGDMKELYASLGKLYFEEYADGDMPKEMAELCEKITSCQHAINEAEQRAALLKELSSVQMVRQRWIRMRPIVRNAVQRSSML